MLRGQPLDRFVPLTTGCTANIFASRLLVSGDMDSNETADKFKGKESGSTCNQQRAAQVAGIAVALHLYSA